MAQLIADYWPKRVASPNMHPFSCSVASKNKLRFLGQGCMWGNLSSPYETEYMLQRQQTRANQIVPQVVSLQNHAQMPLRHFTEHLVGARLGINSKRMGTMWHAPLLQNALQAQGHLIQILNSTQSSKKTNQTCPTYLSTFPQSRAPKYINRKLENPRMRYLLVGDE